MSDKNKKDNKQIWIGLARVKQLHSDGVLGDADQAYTNAIGIAHNKSDFRSQVKSCIEALDLELLRLEGTETLDNRLANFVIDRKLLKLAKRVEKSGELAFGDFHAFVEVRHTLHT